jgi:hypothetical protein
MSLSLAEPWDGFFCKPESIPKWKKPLVTMSKKLKRQVLNSDSLKLDQLFRESGIYKLLNPETTAVECTYFISNESDMCLLKETLDDLQEAREETLKACNFGDNSEQQNKDCEEDERREREQAEENIVAIHNCEKLVLECLIDRSKMQLTDNQWAKEEEDE